MRHAICSHKIGAEVATQESVEGSVEGRRWVHQFVACVDGGQAMEIGSAERKEDEVSRMYPNSNIVSFSSRRLSPSAGSALSLQTNNAHKPRYRWQDQNPHNILRRCHAGFHPTLHDAVQYIAVVYTHHLLHCQ